MNSAQRFSRRPRIIVDWDGTLVPSAWPEKPTDLMPGARDAMLRLKESGVSIMVSSCRLSPWNPYDDGRRTPAEVAAEKQYVRATLDQNGLEFVDIHHGDGKPGGHIYVDDRAMRYAGTPGAWAKTAEKVLMKLGVPLEVDLT